jgi:hypothetical protein
VDPCIFGPPGSGFVIILYGSGSGSGYLHPQAKNKKTLISTILWLLFYFYLWKLM